MTVSQLIDVLSKYPCESIIEVKCHHCGLGFIGKDLISVDYTADQTIKRVQIVFNDWR